MKTPVSLGLLLTLISANPLPAQRPAFAIGVGRSFVGGGDSRVPVGVGGASVTGADQSGIHLRAMVLWPNVGSTMSFRTELFYNRLTSRSRTYAAVGGEPVPSALVDRTIGLVGAFVATLGGLGGVTPYFLFAAGAFESKLGTSPDPASNRVSLWREGLGLGLEVGLGAQFRFAGQVLMLEWRYGQALNATRGVGFMPVMVAVRF